MRAHVTRGTGPALASLAVLGAVILGAVLRLDDALSSPVLPAEDSFSNTAIVREHLRDGTLDPFNEGGSLYPPGMHAYVAAVWVYTGADIYQHARFLPALFGLVGIVGVALLVARWDSPLGAFAAAVAMAVQPEAVFRTSMFAPTAVDLAVLPFLLYALLELLHGKLEWGGVAAPLALFLTLAHPWLLTVIAAAGFLYAVVAAILPMRDTMIPALTARGLALAVAIVGVGSGLALAGCWGACGPGFRDVFPGGARLAAFAPYVMVAALLPAAILFGVRRAKPPRAQPTRKPLPWGAKAAMSALLAVALAAISAPAFSQGMPPYVDLPRMIGLPILILAAVALIALPFIASPAANVGAAFTLVCYPMVIYNPFHSDFWSHRTVAFLALGLAILAGVAVAAAFRGAASAFNAQRLAGTDALKMGGRPVFAAVPVILVLLAVGGVAAATPAPYEGGWYRLYEPCPFDAFQEIAKKAEAEPAAIVVTGDWRPKLVLASLTPNASRVWFDEEFFASRSYQDAVVQGLLGEGRPVYAIVDEYLRNTTSATERDFDHSPWTPAGRWCDETPEHRVAAYVAGGEGS